MDFISGFDPETGTVTAISETASGKLTFLSKFNEVDIKIIGSQAASSNANILELDFSQTLITTIRWDAFYSNSRLQKVTFSPSLITIETNAFKYTKLSQITLPPTVESFDGAFSGCESLTYINTDGSKHFITEPEGVYNKDYTMLIKAHANATTESIKHFDTIKYYGKYALSYTNLEKFTCTEKLTDIPQGLFEGCKILIEVDLILSSATILQYSCFRGCSVLKTVILPPKLKTISFWTFYGCPLSCIFFPSSITEIEEGSFYDITYPTRIYYFGLTNFDFEVFQDSTASPILYVPLNYKYDTLFKLPVQKANLNDMFLVGNGCPKTIDYNNPFNRIVQRFSSFALFIIMFSK